MGKTIHGCEITYGGKTTGRSTMAFPNDTAYHNSGLEKALYGLNRKLSVEIEF
jgi:hypothetical protein